jgi:hypothetical protein
MKKNVESNSVANLNLNNLVFFLPLNDGEMSEIKKALEAAGAECVVKRVGWDVTLNDFRKEVDECLSNGKTPVMVEIDGADQLDNVVIIDHHNKYVGRPASLLQVLDLLGMQPNRWQALVAANDAAYFTGMEALGATKEEMDQVRLYDRSFQLKKEDNGEYVAKFSSDVEKAAVEAIAAMEVKNGVQILHFRYDATAAITDRLWQSGVPQNLLILCQTGESDYFGNWELCQKLQGNDTGNKTPDGWTIYDHFGGWTGGQAEVAGVETGFWGCGWADQREVEDFVVSFFK